MTGDERQALDQRGRIELRSGRRGDLAERPRCVADEAIIAATLEVLGEVGYGNLTTAAVIERSGVSSATLYRRWASKAELVAAAIGSLAAEPVDISTGSLLGDLEVFLRNIARSISRRQEYIIEGFAFDISREPDLDDALRAKFLAPRHEELDVILAAAVERGELTRRPPVEIALSFVVGPVYHRAFALREKLSPAFVRAAAAAAARALDTDR